MEYLLSRLKIECDCVIVTLSHVCEVRDVAQLRECLPSMHDIQPVPHTLGEVVYACNPRTWEIEAGGT